MFSVSQSNNILFSRFLLMGSVIFVCAQRMLDYLKDKKDVGFFLSVQALMQTCRSVMNLVHMQHVAYVVVRLF